MMRQRSKRQEEHDVEVPAPGPRVSQPYPQMQFIAIGPGGTVSNPTAVRSHAIRGFHLKRKEAKRAYQKTLEQQRNTQIRPVGGVGGAPRDAADRSRREAETAKEWERRVRGEEVRTEAPAQELIRREGRELCLLTTIDSRENKLVPYAWFEKNGPVLYVNRTRWPFPAPFQVTGSDRADQRPKDLTPRQSAWMPATRSPDFTTVQGAVLDLSVVSWIGQTPECFAFRLETIQWIQARLRDPKEALSCATIGAIMTFTMWTAGSGNGAEMSSHMDAVERIVNLRGGLVAFVADGAMVAKLTLFDSMIAVLTGAAPRFPHVEYILSQPPSTPGPGPGRPTSLTDSPLSGPGRFEDIITYPHDTQAIIFLLEHMWTLTLPYRRPDLPRPSSCARIPFSTEPRHTHSTHLLTLPLVSSCHDASHNHVLSALHHAAAIWTRSLADLTLEAPSASSSPSFDALCASFAKCSSSTFWVLHPGIQLWVLLVGTAAARGTPEAAFWLFYLSRTGSPSSAASWAAGNEATRTFLRVQRAARTAGAAVD